MADTFADNIFKSIFLNKNGRILIQISLKFVPRSSNDNKSALVQVMAWRQTGDKPLSEQMLTQFTDAYTCIWSSRGRWVNSLGPSDAIWRQRSGSPLAQVMACCLTAPSHYLNQCWLFISKVKWRSSKDNFTRDTSAINLWNYLKKCHSNFPGANELKITKGPQICLS